MRSLLSPVAVLSTALACAAGLAAAGPAVAQEAKPAAAGAADIYLEEPQPTPPPVVVGPGKLTEKYEGGAVRIEREVLKMSDDQIVNNGLFTEYYPNGQKFAEGRYADGVHVGQWSFWHDNGQLCKTVTFKNGRPDGAWDVFRPDGTLLAKRIYKDNQRDGLWIIYQDDGKSPKVEDSYANGQHEGTSRVYFANGKPQREMSFKGGQLDGVMTEWDEAGRKVAEASFKAGKRDGKFTLFRPDGTTEDHMYREGRLVPDSAG